MPKSDIQYPEGAIKGMCEIRALVRRARKGEKIIVYEAIPKNPPCLFQSTFGKNARFDKGDLNIINVKVEKSINTLDSEEALLEVQLRYFNLAGYNKKITYKYSDGTAFLFTNYLLARAYFMRATRVVQNEQD